jgi:hypothetical protein
VFRVGKVQHFSVASGAFPTVHKNRGDRLVSGLIVLITASGLQGEQPLVN